MAEFIVQDERNACSLQRIFPGQPAKNAQESVLANRSEIMENLLYKMMGGGGEGGGEVQQKATRLKRSFHASTTPLLKGYRKRLNTSGQPNTASLLMKFLFQKVLLLNSH